ncbi:SWIB [Musa troglodytarum]|uniref:SWIB n=1 Tax=Musa troglodytarum TaxID=320322 RepID=A0A9E7I8D2_9LILI|nr:SWIB [Musa troglodytarum]
MAATIPSSSLYASAFLTADHLLRRRLVASVAFPLHRRAASATATAVRAASSSKPASGAGARPARGITKPRPVSPAMQAVVGVPEIPRTQALKLIWAYIKEHNLQVTPTFLFVASPFSFSSTSDTRFLLFHFWPLSLRRPRSMYTLDLCCDEKD